MTENSTTPLSDSEIAAARAAIARGETPSFDLVRRFVARIRKTFLASPKAVEKGKTSRNTKPKASEEDVADFF